MGKDSGLRFGGVAETALPAREPRTSVPRIAVLTGGLTQEIWVLRDLGFTADPVATGNTSALNNPNVPDPLAGYDVVFNQAGWPAGATARARLTSFFANHGGYLGAGTGGTAFLTSAGQVAGLTAASRGGNGRSGIVYWDNVGRREQPDRRRLPGARHGDHGPADVVDGGPRLTCRSTRSCPAQASSPPGCGCSMRSRRAPRAPRSSRTGRTRQAARA